MILTDRRVFAPYVFRFFFFFFNDTATTEIYTLSLHDALPICPRQRPQRVPPVNATAAQSPSGERRLPACKSRQLAETIWKAQSLGVQWVLPAGCRQLRASSPRSPGEEAQHARHF